MANLVTLSRLLLVFAVVVIAYQRPPGWLQLANVPLLLLAFAGDGLDGWLARRRGEASRFGALFDIAADRIAELTLWVVLADLDLIPVWVPLVFIGRGVLVDTLRASDAAAREMAPFDLMRSTLGRFLVSGRFMRVLYAVTKAVAFCWLLLLQPLPAVLPTLWQAWQSWLSGIGAALVYAAVAMCILRGVPVIAEFLLTERRERFSGHDGGRAGDEIRPAGGWRRMADSPGQRTHRTRRGHGG